MIATRVLGAVALLSGALAAIVGSPVAQRPLSGSEPDRVSAAELATWQHAKKAGLRVIDVRPTAAFDLSHIPGANDVPLVALVGTDFDRTDTIVLYADTEARADQAWVLLRTRGLPHVYVLRGGFDEWSGGVSARRRGC
jgi:rhodanese-related sulfurtransferase